MGGKGSKESLQDTIFNLRFASKQMQREAQRSEREERKEREKVRRALEKGNVDSARIFGENAIRQHNEALNYLRLGSKLDAVASKIQSAERTQELSRQFGHMIPQINTALKGMDTTRIANTMDQFEKVFEDLDVVSGAINQGLQSATATTAPVSQVDSLLGQIAAEHNIEVQAQIGEVPLNNPPMRQQVAEESKAGVARVNY